MRHLTVIGRHLFPGTSMLVDAGLPRVLPLPVLDR